ncbi:MAG: squalene synthase HpnC [Rubrivivax sp.]
MSVDHYENFPVASVLCPPALRPAVRAIYHFARTADDIADEGDAVATERLSDLADYRADLESTLAGRTASPRWKPVFGALSHAVSAFSLPAGPLHHLLDAFEQDVRNPPYADREALLGYCRLSANPVGRLLLHLYGIRDAVSIGQADAICSALQLINFWQDLSVDMPRGRVYLPSADMHAAGVRADDLGAGVDTELSRALVACLCAWAANLMRQGAPLALRVPGRAGWELRLVVQGGLRILEKIGRMNHAVLSERPVLSSVDGVLIAWRALGMRASHHPGQDPAAGART